MTGEPQPAEAQPDRNGAGSSNKQHTVPFGHADSDSQDLPSLSQESVPNPLTNLFHGVRPPNRSKGDDDENDALTPLSTMTAEAEPALAGFGEGSAPQSNGESGPGGSTVGGPSAPGRSIFSYFGNGSSSGTATPVDRTGKPATAGQPKRKRKAGGDQVGQARLLAGGAAGWVLGRNEDPAAVSESDAASNDAGSSTAPGTKRGKAKTAAGALADEEAELKEMKRKGGKARTAPKGRKRAAGSEQGSQEGPNGSQPSTVRGSQAGSVADETAGQATASTASPQKRKRGRPRKVDTGAAASRRVPSAGTASTSRASPEVVDVRSSDPLDVMDLDVLPLRPAAMSRSTSNMSRGTSHKDAIDVDGSPIATRRAGMPKKLVFASESNRPTHAFFARLKAGPTTDVGGGLGATATAAASTGTPLDETSSEAAGTGEADAGQQPLRPAKEAKSVKVNGFFQLNGKASTPGTLKNGWGHGVREGGEWPAPWPRGLWPTHERASLSLDVCRQKANKRRRVSAGDFTTHDSDWATLLSLENDLHRRASARPPDPDLIDVDEVEYSDHPAIQSVRSRSKGDNRESWCERYRPRRASEVLGNEVEAVYLREWLSALSVGGKDAGLAKVTRRIRRHRTQQLYDDWIVDDAGLFGTPEPADEPEEEHIFAEIDFPPDPCLPRLRDFPSFQTRLGNAMLLVGPPGSGKSAAVYAAAAELGWDVFEVYPGIGKRTGANLLSLVGDVGKNHMVVKSHNDKGAHDHKQDKRKVKAKTKSVQSFFAPRPPADDDFICLPPASQGSAGEPIEVEEGLGDDESGDGEEEQVVAHIDAEHKVRQSLILLEEVDLLFEEEGTFWPAVVSLIAESRRPVILTCNDPSTIPLGQLPLQTILRFEPAGKDLAAAYLSSLARREGVPLPSIPAVIRAATRRVDDPMDQPLPPNGSEPIPYLDLRQAITQLQLERKALARSVRATEKNSDGADDLAALSNAFNYRSFADAWIDQRHWAKLDDGEIDRFTASRDDQLAINHLEKPHLPDHLPILPAYAHTCAISDTLLSLAGADGLPRSETLSVARTNHVRSLLPILDPLIPLSAYLLPHPSLFTDTLPGVLDLIRTEDMLEMAEDAVLADGGERINRKTGRPVRAAAGVADKGFEREIDLAPEALVIARSLVLGS